MSFKKIIIKNTILHEDIINIILEYKNQLDKPYELKKYFDNLFLIKNQLHIDETITFQDFLYYIKYYTNKDIFTNINFIVDLIYVDDCDFNFKIKYDEFFYKKTFDFDNLTKLLSFGFNYLYLSRISLNQNPCYYINNKNNIQNNNYILRIKLYDPHYEKIYKKKNKNIKKIKKFLYSIKKLFL